MKRLFLLICLQIIIVSGFAQSATSEVTKDSVLAVISEQLADIQFRIRGLDRYKLYPTDNIYNLLKLDTMTGKVEQLQWSLDNKNEGTFTINSEDISLNTGCGTFELYPTKNIYQFILLDKVTGRQWHIQWGMDDNKRWIRRIY